MAAVTPLTAEQIEDAKQTSLAYYEDTVFTVNSIDYLDENLHYGDSNNCLFYAYFTVSRQKGEYEKMNIDYPWQKQLPPAFLLDTRTIALL